MPRRPGDAGRPHGDVAAQHLSPGQHHLLLPDLLDRRAEPHVDAAAQQLVQGVRAQAGSNGASSTSPASTSVTCIRSCLISGNVAGSAMLRSSASVPASSTPVAPPPDHGDVQLAGRIGGQVARAPPAARRAARRRHDGCTGSARTRRRPRRRRTRPTPRWSGPGSRSRSGCRRRAATSRRSRSIPVSSPRRNLAPPLAGDRPERVGDVGGGQPGRGHLVEQRLEGAVRMPVDQGHVGARPRQRVHRRQPGEAGPDDHVPARRRPFAVLTLLTSSPRGSSPHPR